MPQVSLRSPVGCTCLAPYLRISGRCFHNDSAQFGPHLPTKLLHLEASAVQPAAWLPDRRVMGGPMPSPFVCSALTAADLLSKLPMLLTPSRSLHPKLMVVCRF